MFLTIFILFVSCGPCFFFFSSFLLFPSFLTLPSFFYQNKKCMGSALSPDGTCKYCIKHANDPLPPSLLFNIQEDNNHMSLIQEKEKEGGGTGKESALQELNRKLKDINERMEAVDDQLREAQGCSTGQDFSLIGKLFMEKQQIEMELKVFIFFSFCFCFALRFIHFD